MTIQHFESCVRLGDRTCDRANEAERHASNALNRREAGYVILALEHRPGLRQEAVPELLRQLGRTSQRGLQSAQGVDGDRLAHKLERLNDSVRSAIVAGARRALTLPPSFLLGSRELFARQALQAAGLAPLSEDPAWGFVVVRLANYSFLELPVRHEPSQIELVHDHTLAEIGHGLRDYAEAVLSGYRGKNDDIGYQMACYLLKKSGQQYLRVEEDRDGGVACETISREALRCDVSDGSLDLLLVGVNAPPI